ncbi:MAG: winged helix-turn-helix domain-containing protein [Longimicrobiales bacterium]|nr:winged helix-turn-helix domain-containing protein [Longimicrobiales bacterium]
MDFRTYAVTKGGAHVPLTLREFELLRHLIEHRDEVTDRASILKEVWGDAWDVFPRTIDTHIAHLRKKLEDDPGNPKHILNVRGIGYRFVADAS